MKTWQRTEKKDAKLFGTHQQKGSGSLDHYPTDSFSDDFGVETKQTDKKSYSISTETWTKLRNEVALLDRKDKGNRSPLLSLHIGDLHLVVMEYGDWSILQETAWKYKDLMDF